MIHLFRVYGEVRGQGRPKADFIRKRVYKSKEDRAYEEKIKREYINSGGMNFGDRPLMMAVFSHRQLPKSKPKSLRQERDTHAPDSSNILKAVEDALNGIAYNDDSQIVCAIEVKMPRMRYEYGDFIEVIISDSLSEYELKDIATKYMYNRRER